MRESVRLMPRELREMFPEARFLTEEEQAKYEEACKEFGEKARESLKVSLKGSNFWKVLLLNKIGIRTASIQELCSAVENGLPLEEFYEDTSAVVLRSAGDSYAKNYSLAEKLAKLAGKESFSNAVVIEGLVPIEDGSSPYGLSCETGERFKVTEAPDFDHKNNRRRFYQVNPDYSIDWGDGNGERTLYTRDNGVSWLCLGSCLSADSGDENLALSNGIGRVVVVSGEASKKNLEQYVSQLKDEEK